MSWKITAGKLTVMAGKAGAFSGTRIREEELRTVPSWKAHQLTGSRKGTWSLFVTRSWRMTFRIDAREIEIIDLDYEDYH